MAVFDYENMPPFGAPDKQVESTPRYQRIIPNILGVMAVTGALVGVPMLAGLTGGKESSPVPIEVKYPPKNLPLNVKRQTGSVVKLFNNPAEGSGVKIGPNLVLTAGHAMGNNLTPSHKHCGNVGVQTRYDLGVDQMSGTSGWVAQFDQNSTTKPDLALVQVTSDGDFQRVPTARLAQTRPKLGSLVYFDNYETNAKGASRFPNSTLATRNRLLSGDQEENFGAAAMYAGAIVGWAAPYIIVATGLRGYNKGQSFTQNTYPGASGGPLFDSKGEVFGISVRVDKPGSVSVSSLEREGVKLPLPARGLVSLTWVTAVSPRVVEKYQAKLNSGPACAGL